MTGRKNAVKQIGMALLATAAALYILAATMGASTLFLLTILALGIAGVVLILAGRRGAREGRNHADVD